MARLGLSFWISEEAWAADWIGHSIFGSRQLTRSEVRKRLCAILSFRRENWPSPDEVLLPPRQYQTANFPASPEPSADWTVVDERRADYLRLLHQADLWRKIADNQKLTALVELSNLDEDEKELQLAIKLSQECADEQLFKKMIARVQQIHLQTLEQVAHIFRSWKRHQAVVSWVAARKKQEEEEDELVQGSLADEIFALVHSHQRVIVPFTRPITRASPIQQVEFPSSPSSSSAAQGLTVTDIQQLIDAKLAERFSLFESQTSAKFQSIFDAIKEGEKKQKKEAKKARKREEKARRKILEEQLKRLQDIVTGSRQQKTEGKKGEGTSEKKAQG